MRKQGEPLKIGHILNKYLVYAFFSAVDSLNSTRESTSIINTSHHEDRIVDRDCAVATPDAQTCVSFELEGCLDASIHVHFKYAHVDQLIIFNLKSIN